MRSLGREGRLYDGIVTAKNTQFTEDGRRIHHGYSEESEQKYKQEIKGNIIDSNILAFPTHDISGVIDLTADITGMPKKVVKACVYATFRELKNWLDAPYGTAAMMINDFGTFALNLKVLNARLYNLIPFLRGKQRDKHIDKFRELWRRRQMAIEYENRRKSTDRKLNFEFKKKDKKSN